ncbi:MAG TPA: hypothetical protein VF836_07145 [Gemmatimonadaceae bacterium]
MSYLDEARQRARRRRSPWDLLLIPAFVSSLGLLWWFFVALLLVAHRNLYLDQDLASTPRGVGPILTTVSPLLAAIPLAMLFANALVWIIPPARRALEREAMLGPRASFQTTQGCLLRGSTLMVPIALALGILGTLMSWR